ncbi:MAG: glycoside hydrolase, partial [Actinobacteria bacterium]|nr:glycoside hydrolase [Actinomycetota bacterium]
MMTTRVRTQVLAALLVVVAGGLVLAPQIGTAGSSLARAGFSENWDLSPAEALPQFGSSAAGADAPLNTTMTDQAPGGRAVAHYAGGIRIRDRRIQKMAPHAVLRPTGTQAFEPSLGIDKDGTIFFVGLDGPAERTPFGLVPLKIESLVTRSTDNGKTWKDVSPMAGPERRHALFVGDPYLHVDKDTGRVFTADIQAVACATTSFSDDKGASWLTSEACGLADHQTVFTGPPVSSPTVGYPNIVYYCAIDGGAFAEEGTQTSCLKSLNGGLDWIRTGSPAFSDDPSKEGGMLGIPGHCGGATGHGVVGDDGTIYLPRGWCRQPWLAISHDEGLTWERVQVADSVMPYDEQAALEEHEAAVAVDKDGNLYYAWNGRDRLFYLATSTDGGKTWSKPMMIAAPGLKETWGPAIDVG